MGHVQESPASGPDPGRSPAYHRPDLERRGGHGNPEAGGGFALSRRYFEPMRAGDSSAAQQLFSHLNRQRDDPFVEFRLQVETYTLTDTGIVKEAKPDITYRGDPAASK